ncbi:YlcG family protein [Mixta hanseatica]|uniref:YlcG family protein n=1 Tax=Mixta hanseatica TaxID=2872648 RepID=A0ABY4RF40_9GAMM|nr:YlcG family protein [Mixta hanseatica]UQY45049.1 YlcG family protein [Mixta hanseatica]
MTEYLKEKWLKLRIMKMRGMYEIYYRILRNTAKIMGAKHAR